MKPEYPECGIPLAPSATLCPRCGARWRRKPDGPLLVVDVAHGGETWEEARRRIDQAVDRAVVDSHRGVKVIHRRGSGPGDTHVIRDRAVAHLGAITRRHGGRLEVEPGNPGDHVLRLDGRR